MRARIFSPPTFGNVSLGRSGTDAWVLEFEQTEPRVADPLMGWIGSADTQAQVALRFNTREDAIAYADRNAIPYDIELPQVRKIKPKAYAENFRFGRRDNWTH